MNKGNFGIRHYTNWNETRMRAINNYYPEDFFEGKTVLEVGCGWADVGNEISKLGADVTASDARWEHLEQVKLRHPHLATHVFDLENENWTFPEEHYDVIIHFGVLYHLSNPVQNLELISEHCSHLIIETEVLDSDDPELIQLVEETQIWDQGAWGSAFSGTGCKPSYGMVEATLKRQGMSVVPAPAPHLLNASTHHYDWNRKNDGSFKPAQRAFWFCEKK
jgi:hypothetical protein